MRNLACKRLVLCINNIPRSLRLHTRTHTPFLHTRPGLCIFRSGDVFCVKFITAEYVSLETIIKFVCVHVGVREVRCKVLSLRGDGNSKDFSMVRRLEEGGRVVR